MPETSERIRLQVEISAADTKDIDAALNKIRAHSRVGFVRKAVEVLLILVKVYEEDGSVMLIRKDGVRERIRL